MHLVLLKFEMSFTCVTDSVKTVNTGQHCVRAFLDRPLFAAGLSLFGQGSPGDQPAICRKRSQTGLRLLEPGVCLSRKSFPHENTPPQDDRLTEPGYAALLWSPVGMRNARPSHRA